MVASIKQAVSTETNSSGAKSGIKTFKQGAILFREKEPAESLFIIQRGQVRLFVQKGKGFVDIAILRAGDVFGEMAYFDEKDSRRSCSAEAITGLEVVEITFKAFDKTMSGVNPWFRTIVNTLAERLRKTNDKVKSLESNSVSFGSDGKLGNYVFFHNIDVVRILALIYMIYKSHGEMVAGKLQLHFDKLKMYMIDIFNVPEIKFEEFIGILKNEAFMTIEKDETKLPKIHVIDNAETFRQFMVYFNTQRSLDNIKRINISHKGQIFLDMILKQIKGKVDGQGKAMANITVILNEFKEKNMGITQEDLMDSAHAGFVGDLVIGENGSVVTTVMASKLEKMFPCIRLQNAVKKINEKKASTNN